MNRTIQLTIKSFRSNAAATLESPLSSKYSLDQEHHHHNAQDAQKPSATTSGEISVTPLYIHPSLPF